LDAMQRIKIYFLAGTSILLMAMALLFCTGCVVMTKKQFKKVNDDTRLIGQLEGMIKASEMQAKRGLTEKNINEEPYE